MITREERYKTVIDEVKKLQPHVIVEIGVYKGDTAERMIKVCDKPIYYGFDAFGPVGAEELPYSDFPDMDEVRGRLEATGATINLIKGNTKDTLKDADITPDFVFIDGGHSLETIQNDWDWVKEHMHDKTVVIFDDYYVGDDTKGCRKLVEGIKGHRVEILQPGANFPKYIVHFVKVTNE